jgi:hypothetical protein
MFLASRKSVVWRWASVAVAALLVISYLAYDRTSPFTHGGTPAGLAYGIAAALLVVVLALFGLRKRAYRSKLGTLEGWLQAHVYLGLLVLLVALLHTGFRFADRVAVAAFVVLAVVVVSGAVGAALYTTLPRLLTEVESNLTAAETSERLNRLAASMARLASGRSRAFEGVYRQLVSEATPRGLAGWKLLLGRVPGSARLGERAKRAGTGGGSARWTRLLATVPPEEQEPLRQLLVVARQHRELLLRFAYQERYKNLLDAWLWIHLPLSVALLVLIAAHVLGALYFGALS